jgi:pteridine reductase
LHKLNFSNTDLIIIIIMSKPTVLITGSAVRLGKAIAKCFFERGCNLVLHYNQSSHAAKALKQHFNHLRSSSCEIVEADLNCPRQRQRLIEQAILAFGRLDHLVNNASIFYPNPIETSKTQDIDSFMLTNFIAPTCLAKEAMPELKKSNGSIVNLIDIYASAGLTEHSAYVASKAALLEATKQLAIELAPEIRVNAVSPGAILWPEQTGQQKQLKQQIILKNTALKKLGKPSNIGKTVCYLALDAVYTTGSEIKVDGGRSLFI